MDVANQNSVKSAFETLEQTGEKIDICINNAGIAKLTPIFEDDLEKDFENQIQTNVMGVWYVTKAVA
jgi:NADP-dependent 3-hydroxy acid dehydrogenase YdfG